jgi:hypothetical protein
MIQSQETCLCSNHRLPTSDGEGMKASRVPCDNDYHRRPFYFAVKVTKMKGVSMVMATTNHLLMGYTVADAKYTTGSVGNITDDGVTIAPVPDQVTDLLPIDGDPTVYSFFNASHELRVVVAQYNTKTKVSDGIAIYDPTTTPWTSIASDLHQDWNSIVNLYGVIPLNGYLYAMDYDSATIAKIDMTDEQYTEVASYQFTTGPAGYGSYGVAIEAINNKIYGLFIAVNNPWTNADYQSSTVVELDSDLKLIQQVSVGKNAFTLEPYNNQLYVACIGGKQQVGNYNAASEIDVVTLGDTMTVTTPITTATSNVGGDFRDIIFNNKGEAYILVGYYDSTGKKLNWTLYQSTATKINAKDMGTSLSAGSTLGYIRALFYAHRATDRLCFAKGNQIDICNPSDASTMKSMAPADLGSAPNNKNLNSVTLFPQVILATHRRRASRSLAAHTRLAKHARHAAQAIQAAQE